MARRGLAGPETACPKPKARSLVFVDESGFYLLPGLVRTYGLKGHTPVLKEWRTRDHLSVIGALTTTGQIYTLVRQKALTGLEVIEFLTHLGHQLNGAALVIWDRSPIHRRSEVNEFIATIGAKALEVECFAVCPGSQPGGVALASSEAGGDGQPDLPRHRRVAWTVPLGSRTCAG